MENIICFYAIIDDTATNDILVEYFLNDKIKYLDIPNTIEEILYNHEYIKNLSLDDINYLITSLTEINKPKSLRVAKELKSLKNNDNSYNLIIRRANLNSLDAKIISKAIEKIKNNDGPLLDKISMSFNKDITDDGLGYILEVLP